MTANTRNPWTLYGPWPCHQCRYNMQGLTGPIIECPECGASNDLSDVQQWDRIAGAGAVEDYYTVTRLAASTFLGVVFVLTGFVRVAEGDFPLGLTSLGLAVAIGFVAFSSWRKWRTGINNSSFAHRILAMLLLLTTLAIATPWLYVHAHERLGGGGVALAWLASTGAIVSVAWKIKFMLKEGRQRMHALDQLVWPLEP